MPHSLYPLLRGLQPGPASAALLPAKDAKSDLRGWPVTAWRRSARELRLWSSWDWLAVAGAGLALACMLHLTMRAAEAIR